MIDPIFRELEKFINTLLSKDLTLAQQQRCFQIKKLLADIERIGDLAEDMAEFELEREFDRMYWLARQPHIHRIEEGRCHPQADVIFTETLRMLERISDHADNVAVSVARAAS